MTLPGRGVAVLVNAAGTIVAVVAEAAFIPLLSHQTARISIAVSGAVSAHSSARSMLLQGQLWGSGCIVIRIVGAGGSGRCSAGQGAQHTHKLLLLLSVLIIAATGSAVLIIVALTNTNTGTSTGTSTGTPLLFMFLVLIDNDDAIGLTSLGGCRSVTPIRLISTAAPSRRS